MLDLPTKAALFFPAFFALVAFCACFQRRLAQRRGGWNYLTPGPYFWLGLLAGVIITAVATLVVAGGRVERLSGLLFTTGFALVTLALAGQALVEEVRWNRERIERRTVFGTRIGLGWHELARLGGEWTGYVWISSFEGPRLRFSPHDNGFEQLMHKVRYHLPRNGPPAVQELAEPPVLAMAGATSKARR